MKKSNIFAVMGAMLAIIACNPEIDDKPMGAVPNERQLQLEVYNLTEGSNAIVLKNNTKGVGSYWDTGTQVSTRRCDTIVMPYVGDITVRFIGLAAGGQVETLRTVHVSKIDHPVQREWTLLAGSSLEGKRWTWDTENYGEAVYGTAGWLTQVAPAWDVRPLSDLVDKDHYMVFDLNGGPNLKKVDSAGNVLEQGTFGFDMAATKNNPENGKLWSMGQLTVSGVTLLDGHAFYDVSNKITVFQILKLTDDEMVLCWNPADADAWTDATFWVLRSK